jgi:hypothetical protein
MPWRGTASASAGIFQGKPIHSATSGSNTWRSGAIRSRADGMTMSSSGGAAANRSFISV